MTCKLDHSDPDTLPAFLCRACNPSLNRTIEQREALDNAERERNRIAMAELARTREIDRTRAKIDAMRAKDPEPGSVPAKILAGLERKLAKLEGVL